MLPQRKLAVLCCFIAVVPENSAATNFCDATSEMLFTPECLLTQKLDKIDSRPISMINCQHNYQL